MNIDQLKTEAGKLILDAVKWGTDADKSISFVPGELLQEEPGESISIEGTINFVYGNCSHSHAVIIGWNEGDGIGFEVGKDSEIYPISGKTVFSTMYYDLAMKGLADECLL